MASPTWQLRIDWDNVGVLLVNAVSHEDPLDAVFSEFAADVEVQRSMGG